MRSTYFSLIFFLVSVQAAPVKTLIPGKPETVGMSSNLLARIDSVVEEAIQENFVPGVVVLVGRHSKIVYNQAFGHRSLIPSREKMTIDTIFDLSSLTKVVATATSMMILVEEGILRPCSSVPVRKKTSQLCN